MTTDEKSRVAQRATDIADQALNAAEESNARAMVELARAQFYMTALGVLLEPLGGTMTLTKADCERLGKCSLISVVNEEADAVEITLVRGQS